MLLSRGVPGRSRKTSEQESKCLEPKWLPGVGQRWVRQGSITRGLQKSAVAEGPRGKDTCSEEVIHKVDDLLLRDLRGSISFFFV